MRTRPYWETARKILRSTDSLFYATCVKQAKCLDIIKNPQPKPTPPAARTVQVLGFYI